MSNKQYNMLLLTLFLGIPVVTIVMLLGNILADRSFFILNVILISTTNILSLFLGISFVRKVGIQNVSFGAFIDFVKHSKLALVLGVLYACTVMMMTTFILFKFLFY